MDVDGRFVGQGRPGRPAVHRPSKVTAPQRHPPKSSRPAAAARSHTGRRPCCSPTTPTRCTNPPKTLDELLAWIKANPGQFTYNSPKSGGSGGAFVDDRAGQVRLAGRAATQMTTGYHKALETKWDQGFAGARSRSTRTSTRRASTPTATTRSLQLLSAGQIAMAPVWSDQFITGQEPGRSQELSRPSRSTTRRSPAARPTSACPRARRTRTCAWKFTGFVLTPDEQAKIADKIAGYPAIPLSKLPARCRRSSRRRHPEPAARLLQRPRHGHEQALGRRRSPVSEQRPPATGAVGSRLAQPPLLLIAVFVGFPIVLAVGLQPRPHRRAELDRASIASDQVTVDAPWRRPSAHTGSCSPTRGSRRDFAVTVLVTIVTTVIVLVARLGDRALPAAVGHVDLPDAVGARGRPALHPGRHRVLGDPHLLLRRRVPPLGRRAVRDRRAGLGVHGRRPSSSVWCGRTCRSPC